MGRIKTTLIKRTTLKLFKQYKDQLKGDFDENKKIVEQFTDVESKKVRNTIAGYLTRLVKTRKD